MNKQRETIFVRRFCRIAAITVGAVLYCVLVGSSAVGAITSAGDISPVPPVAGGAVAGQFNIGNVDVATMTINTSGGPSPLTNTQNAVLGGTVTGIGIVNMSGLGSDWTLTTSTGDMIVGQSGSGSLNLSNLAFVSIADDLFVAGQLNSTGKISISGLGTIVDVGGDANIGQRGQAIIEITNGGRLVTELNIIGDEAAGDGRVTLSDAFSVWRTTNTLLVADAGRGVLQIFDGARVENTGGSVAQQAGSHGTVEVVGPGSQWDNTLNLIVGEFGRGTLTVADGGRVINGGGANSFIIGRQSGSTGIVEVRGAGSAIAVSLMDVGDSGDGTLRILEGGRVISGISILGDNATARGVVLVDGNGSRWDASGAIDVGDFGEAHLTVSNGGVVHTSSIARVASLGKLTLDDGRLEIETSPVSLTNAGVIDGNGTIEAPTANNTASGRIRPQGAEPLLFTGTLNNSGSISLNGGQLQVQGILTNTNLGTINVEGGRLRAASAVTNNGPLNLIGGEVQFSGPVTNLEHTGAINVRDGILRFDGGLTSHGSMAISFGTTDVFGDITNSVSGQIVVSGGSQATFYDDIVNSGLINVSGSGSVKSTAVFFGEVTGAGSYPGTGTVFFEGELHPGASPAEVEFGGDLTLGGSARTVMEVGGAEVGSGHDQLHVAGVLSVDGALSVELLDGFAPRYGDAFDLFDFGGLVGQFDSIQLPPLAAGLAWRTDELYRTGTVAVVLEPGAVWLARVGMVVCGLAAVRFRVRRVDFASVQ